jgi:hypothetical protein
MHIVFIGHRSPCTFSKRVIKGKGKPRFALQVTFDVASNPVVIVDVNKVSITKKAILRRLGCKKDQSVFMAISPERAFPYYLMDIAHLT